MKTTVNQAQQPIAKLLLAHGAGAGKDSDFMQSLAEQLALNAISVVRFDFPYMQVIAQTGKKRPPDKMEKLQACFMEQIEREQGDLPLFIGGKSMGGRVSSTLLDATEVAGGLCFGYPFHPPGKPDKLRTEHLETMGKPLLIVQGERDTFGNQTEVGGYSLSKTIQLAYLPDGDHSFKPRKASGLSQEQHIAEAARISAQFIQGVL